MPSPQDAAEEEDAEEPDDRREEECDDCEEPELPPLEPPDPLLELPEWTMLETPPELPLELLPLDGGRELNDERIGRQ